MENNYRQVGQTIECGNCHPEKFENCKEIIKKYPTIVCNCICHSVSAIWENEFEKMLPEKWKDTVASDKIKSFIRELLGKVRDEISAHLKRKGR